MTPPVADAVPAAQARPGFDLLLRVARGRFGALGRLAAIDRVRLGWIGLFLVLGWLSTGIFKVEPDQEGVVVRLGSRGATVGPGLHYHLPVPFESVLLPAVTRINQIQFGRSADGPSRSSAMITGDQNIVEVDALVLWKIRDAGDYLFDVADPGTTLTVATETAIREVIGRNPIQSALSDRRQDIADDIRASLQGMLDAFGAGIEITQVQLQRVDPPAPVIDAFNDVQRAKSDGERARNEADAYRNEIIPRARAQALRVTEDAKAYRRQVTSTAEGDVAGFRAVLASYRAAPDMTAWRLYLDSVDAILRRASRVVLDGAAGGRGSVLPLLQIGDGGRAPILLPPPPIDPAASASRPPVPATSGAPR